MSETLTSILKEVLNRLLLQATTYLPPLIAAGIVFLVAYILASLVRRLLYRIFKGTAIDRFMRRTGIAHVIDPSGHVRATRMTAESAYWAILVIGVLAGLGVFGTDLTSQLIQNFVFLVPRLAIAGLLVLAGVWLSQYLGRCMLVWAFNENLPHPRRLAAGSRVAVLFVAIVTASDYLNFARSVFLTAFVIFIGGFVLAVSLAVGIGASSRVRTLFHEAPKSSEEEPERSLWTHL